MQAGLSGLFVTAFLAATILPLSSEVVVTALIINGYTPTHVVVVATIGNVLGSVTNYCIGMWAGEPLAKRVLRISDEALKKAQHRFERYGMVALCLAWVPIIGDPITIVAGLLRVHLGIFLLFVTFSKFARYYVISDIALRTMG